MKYPILFALLTGLCWGVYGPALGQARGALGSPFKPYVAIGVAYLVWGIIGGLLGMWYKGDDFSPASFSGAGGVWGFIAGSLGAWGALALTLAMFVSRPPMPHVVMPIVFGSAVVVSALVSVWMTRASANPWLWVGIAGMAVCIVLVAYNTPHGAPHKPAAASGSAAVP
jgi:hypothetical protein